jgi:catalase (peroxidase I)
LCVCVCVCVCVWEQPPTCRLLVSISLYGNLFISHTHIPSPFPPLPSHPHQNAQCSRAEYDAIARMFNDTDLALERPAALRLAFHTCGTFTALDASGGCDGAWLRHGPDADAVPNTGLAEHVAVLEKVKAAHPCITYADLYTFAGSVATELAGGPAIAWQPGRVDALGHGPSAPPFSSRIPEANINAPALGYYATQSGLSPREMVALVGGGHSIGAASTSKSGWNMVFVEGDDWPTPVNRYFVDLVERQWVQAEAPETGLPQWVLAPEEPLAGDAGAFEGKPIGRLPSDMALLFSRVFEPVVREYARDAARFMADFALVTQKLLALGSPGVGSAAGDYKWKGLDGKWEGWGADAAVRSLDEGGVRTA